MKECYRKSIQEGIVLYLRILCVACIALVFWLLTLYLASSLSAETDWWMKPLKFEGSWWTKILIVSPFCLMGQFLYEWFFTKIGLLRLLIKGKNDKRAMEKVVVRVVLQIKNGFFSKLLAEEDVYDVLALARLADVPEEKLKTLTEYIDCLNFKKLLKLTKSELR